MFIAVDKVQEWLREARQSKADRCRSRKRRKLSVENHVKACIQVSTTFEKKTRKLTGAEEADEDIQ